MRTMSQHFLLSAAARVLSLKEIYRGGEDNPRLDFAAVLFCRNQFAHHPAMAAGAGLSE